MPAMPTTSGPGRPPGAPAGPLAAPARGFAPRLLAPAPARARIAAAPARARIATRPAGPAPALALARAARRALALARAARLVFDPDGRGGRR